MSNPYESPPEVISSPSAVSRPLPPPQPPGLVGHIRIVAILMIVQGVLELLMGFFLIGMSFMAVTVMKDMFANNPAMPPPGQGPSPEVMGNVLFGTYLSMGIAAFLLGLLHCYAGYQNFNFRGRMLGLIGSLGGLGAIITCYCLPTGIALCVYGLIVHFNASVAAAFQMQAEGFSADAILATFSRYHYEQSRQTVS
jgi:hypothetical protein